MDNPYFSPRNFLVIFVFLILLFGCQNKNRKPNFMLIVADDLGWMDLECYGSSFYDTPNLNKLAGEGILFTNGYASCPVCSPTRSSIQTGKYPVKTGITDWIPGRVAYRGTTENDRWMNLSTKNELNLDEITIAEVMQQNGYKTFFAGKWHLGQTEEYWPESQGYEINKGGHNRGAPNRNRDKGTNGYFSPYGNPRLMDGPEGEHLPDRLADETIKFIEHNKDQAFFACLAFYLVHTPLQAKEGDIARYEQKREEMKIDTTGEIIQNPVWAQYATKSRYKERMKQGLPVYAGMMHSLDYNIGRVMDALESAGIADNTVVIFTSDNGGLSTAEGWPTSNAPLRAGKGWLYEGGIRVPFIVKTTDANNAGIKSDLPVSSIDIFPTILGLAGIKSDLSTMDGVDAMSYIGNENDLLRPLFWHYPHYANQGGNPGSVIRMGDYKLFHDFETGRKELYNLSEDIGEIYDLSEEKPELADSLFLMLDQWRKETGAVMMNDFNPEWNGMDPISVD